METYPSVAIRDQLSAPGLLASLRKCFDNISDHRSDANMTVSLTDALMSAVAMFGMKSPSLLQFDEKCRKTPVARNLQTLYGIEHVPCDTRMREIIDPIEPASLRPAFKAIFASLQRGKALESYHFLDGAFLASIDGTGYFSSSEVHCGQCCVKEDRQGNITYYHQMLGAALVHPERKNVIALCPESIIKQDGISKNDCERNAAGRLLRALRREHPHLKLIIVEDSLASNGPHIRLLKELDMGFILGVKPGDHGGLFDLVDETEKMGGVARLEMNTGKTQRIFRWINDVPLSDTHADIKVNFLEYWEINGSKTLHFSWITDVRLSEKKVYKVMRAGRSRWRIENETFNTLKNQGYEFEHNFGHGVQNLSVNFAYLMLLAFLVDQTQELCCRLFQAAKERCANNRRLLWSDMKSLFTAVILRSWEEFYGAIAFGYRDVSIEVCLNTS